MSELEQIRKRISHIENIYQIRLESLKEAELELRALKMFLRQAEEEEKRIQLKETEF